MSTIWSKKNSAIIVMIALAIVVIGALAYYFFLQHLFDKRYDLQAELQKCETRTDKDVCRFRAHFNQDKNYRATVSGPNQTKSFIEVDGDKRHYVVTTHSTTSESILVGRTGYFKAKGVWYRKNDACGGKDCSSVALLNLPDKIIFKKIGKEQCGGYTCFKYDVSMNDGKNQFKGTLWFDDTKYQTRRTITQNGPSMIEATYDYGNVHITVPSDYLDAGSVKSTAPQQQTPSQSMPAATPQGFPAGAY